MLKCINSNFQISFIMPHRESDNTLIKIHLDEAVKSIGEQTDKNWFLIIFVFINEKGVHVDDRNKLHSITNKEITINFYIKLTGSLLYGQQVFLAEEILRKVRDISHDFTQQFITQNRGEIQNIYR